MQLQLSPQGDCSWAPWQLRGWHISATPAGSMSHNVLLALLFPEPEGHQHPKWVLDCSELPEQGASGAVRQCPSPASQPPHFADLPLITAHVAGREVRLSPRGLSLLDSQEAPWKELFRCDVKELWGVACILWTWRWVAVTISPKCHCGTSLRAWGWTRKHIWFLNVGCPSLPSFALRRKAEACCLLKPRRELLMVRVRSWHSQEEHGMHTRAGPCPWPQHSLRLSAAPEIPLFHRKWDVFSKNNRARLILSSRQRMVI